MADLHHNVFGYYRGSQKSHQEGERQLENNTTKALVNCLEHCTALVAVRFLDWIGIRADTTPVKFQLQKKTIGGREIRGKSQRLLLALVPKKGDEDFSSIVEGKTHEGDGCPDAWLFGESFAVLIESKVVGGIDLDQIARHYNKLGAGGEKRPTIEVRTWADVHHFFKELVTGKGKDLSNKDKWIIGQLTQYLEEIGMAEFTGIEEEVFHYVWTPENEEARQKVYGTLQALADKIKAELKDIPFYEDYDVGVIHRTDTHAWVAFGPKGKEYRQWAHQTVAINAYGLDVFVNVELKAATERVKKRIRGRADTFRKLILSLLSNEPYCVQIEERKKKQASIYDYHPLATLDARYLKDSELGSHGFECIQRLVKRIALPYLTVRRRIDRTKCLELAVKDQGRSLVCEVVRIMRAFHRLVEFINED